jgi:hypothetical protein
MGTYPDQPAIPTVGNDVPTPTPVDSEYAAFLAWKSAQTSKAAEAAPVVLTPPAASPVTEVKDAVESAFENDTYAKSLEARIEALTNPQPGLATQLGLSMADELASMKAAMEAMKAEFAAKLAAAPAPAAENQSGPPIPHHLHLEDGTILKAFEGVATHIANLDGTISRVVNAFPVK